MEHIAITGSGSYIPRSIVSNADLPPLDKPMTADELARIGVHSRAWSDDSETIAYMAATAGARALEQARVRPEDLDFVILANWTARRYIPEHAPDLLQRLGARRAFGWDVSCACAGFLYGLGIAHGLLQNPRFSKALVVASEHSSRRGRPGSKAKVILGDASGAFVLERRSDTQGRLLDYELTTDGANHGIMSVNDDGWVRTHIEQRQLNELAGTSMCSVARTLLDRNGLRIEDIDWIIPHSGTAGVQATVVRMLGAPVDRILANFDRIGNVSSASIPTVLDEAVRSGKVRSGDRILSVAVGTGWYAAGALYTAASA